MKHPTIALLLAGTTALGACAPTGGRLAIAATDSFALGRNSGGEPCTATRQWRDAAAPDLFDYSWLITCRNVAAARPLGAVRVTTPTRRGALDAQLACAPAVPVTLRSGRASARRCYDKSLGTETIAVEQALPGGRILVATATPALAGPLEEAAAIVAGVQPATGDAGRVTTSSLDIATLAPLPGGVQAAQTGAFDAPLALAQGIGLNHKGLHVEASRVLNDALSRLPADAPAPTRVGLLLEAALADSNINFTGSADEHFTRADALMASDPAAAAPFLQRKRDTYRALDLLNRRQFRPALAALDRLTVTGAGAADPLSDPAFVRVLNRSGDRPRDVARAVSVPDTAELEQLVLDAQANWARSVALLSLGDTPGAEAALAAAERSYAPVRGERIDRAQVMWLGARIARQRGRLAARRRDWPAALGALDGALAELRTGALATAGTGTEPAIAEARLERAAVFAASGADRAAARAEYAEAVDALIAAGATGTAPPVGIEGYFDLLVAEANGTPQADTFERFFRAMQATGEPAVARQLSQIQTVVTADPAIGVKVRDRAELEREITRLRYAISTGGASMGAGDAPAVPAAELERQRADAEARLLAIDNELAGNARFRAVDDRPATIADLRAALRPGEGYLKVIQFGSRAYGLFVDGERAFAYRIAGSAKAVGELNQLALDVRASIDGKVASEGTLVAFADAKAHVLYRLITGPAYEAVTATRALVVDPGGPLQKLPIGALVTRFDPAAKRPSGFDFSQTAFLAATTTISTAVSPRSFLVARSLPASAAPNPFMGFGEHQPPAAGDGDARTVSVGFGCSVPFAQLASLSRQFTPIPATELRLAADALGVPQAPIIIDASFSDSAIETRGDLNQYQVLHFATHGLEEGVWGCAKSPPALVTSFGDANSDGLLSFSEIAALRLDANLVVLSACDTASGVRDEGLARASGQEEAGSTLEGLVRAFLTANARAVLATYWQVSAEQESEDFIRAFYTAARTQTIGGSLQDAQRLLMRNPRFSHPFYWAPYFVVGDSTKPLLTRAQQTAAR